MSNKKPNIKLSRERIKIMKRIGSDIEDCEIEDRKYILNIIAEKLGPDLLYQEGTGTRLVFSIIDNDLLNKIDELVQQAREKTRLNLDSDSDEEIFTANKMSDHALKNDVYLN